MLPRTKVPELLHASFHPAYGSESSSAMLDQHLVPKRNPSTPFQTCSRGPKCNLLKPRHGAHQDTRPSILRAQRREEQVVSPIHSRLSGLVFQSRLCSHLPVFLHKLEPELPGMFPTLLFDGAISQPALVRQNSVHISHFASNDKMCGDTSRASYGGLLAVIHPTNCRPPLENCCLHLSNDDSGRTIPQLHCSVDQGPFGFQADRLEVRIQ